MGDLLVDNSIVEILSSTNKKELTAKCKRIEVNRDDFTAFISLCNSGFCHLEHRMKFFDLVPDDVKVRDEDWAALSSSPADMNSIQGKKSIRRLFMMHGLRKYIVGHLFIERNAIDNPEWHFIFFNLNEIKDQNNHWSQGAHIHLVNYLFTDVSVQNVWNEFITKSKTPNSKLHIRYRDSTRNQNT